MFALHGVCICFAWGVLHCGMGIFGTQVTKVMGPQLCTTLSPSLKVNLKQEVFFFPKSSCKMLAPFPQDCIMAALWAGKLVRIRLPVVFCSCTLQRVSVMVAKWSSREGQLPFLIFSLAIPDMFERHHKVSPELFWVTANFFLKKIPNQSPSHPPNKLVQIPYSTIPCRHFNFFSLSNRHSKWPKNTNSS